jgi:apolipoprotein D and lipocalin family protein
MQAPLMGQIVTAVPVLDQKQMQGTWYEVARLPNKREKSCISDAVELIAPGNKANTLSLVDSCKTATEYNNVRNYTAKPQDKHKPGSGAFKITTLYPRTRKYWVLATGPAYEWTLIGSPDHKGLWIYSKTPMLDPETLSSIKAKAAAEGFAFGKLVASPQTQPGLKVATTIANP